MIQLFKQSIFPYVSIYHADRKVLIHQAAACLHILNVIESTERIYIEELPFFKNVCRVSDSFFKRNIKHVFENVGGWKIFPFSKNAKI